MDGTLVDTEPLAAQAVYKTAMSFGVKIDIRRAQNLSGCAWSVVMDKIFEIYSFPVSKEEAFNQVMKTYRTMITNNVPPVAGSVDAVKNLYEKYPLAVVSSSSRREIDWILNQLKISPYFKFVLGYENFNRVKPAPDAYLKAIEKFGNLQASEVLVFEDSLIGMRAAKDAGTKVVAVTTSTVLQNTNIANWIIKDFTEINTKWVQNLKL